MEWLRKHNIRPTFTSGHGSQANGLSERWIDLVKSTVSLATNQLSTKVWSRNGMGEHLGLEPRKKLPKFGHLALIRLCGLTKYQDRGTPGVMMRYPSILNGVTEITAVEGRLLEFHTAHVSNVKVDDRDVGI